MTSHAYQYQTNPHHHSSEPNLSQYDRVPLSDNSNSTTTKSNEKYGTTKKTQLPPNKTMEIQQSNSIKRKQVNGLKRKGTYMFVLFEKKSHYLRIE